MQIQSPVSAPFPAPSLPAPRRLGRAWHPLRIIGPPAAVFVALAFLFAARSPGDAIHNDLVSGAAALRAIPASASPESVTAALRAALPGRALRIDAAGFPAAVAVTFQDLDWQSCAAAERSARRLEGRVVVELEGFASPADCGDRNDMTWRLMP
jgi:hypothetical protein